MSLFIPDTSRTFKTAKGKRTELVMVHPEHFQRRRQRRDRGNLVAVEVQLVQKGQVLHDTEQRRRRAEVERVRRDENWMLLSKSIILRLGLPSRAQSQLTEIHQMREFQICASLPCHLSCGILSEASRRGSSVKAAVVDVCQVKAVDWIALQYSCKPVHQFSVITGMRAKKKIKEKSSSKNNFLSYFTKSLAAAVFRQVSPASSTRWLMTAARNDWSECGGCLNVVGDCVRPVVIRRLAQSLFLEKIS